MPLRTSAAPAPLHHESLCPPPARPGKLARGPASEPKGPATVALYATPEPKLSHITRQARPDCRGFCDISVRDGADSATSDPKCRGIRDTTRRTNRRIRRTNPANRPIPGFVRRFRGFARGRQPAGFLPATRSRPRRPLFCPTNPPALDGSPNLGYKSHHAAIPPRPKTGGAKGRIV